MDNSTLGQDYAEFLADEELKTAINSTVVGTLDELFVYDGMSDTDAALWNATKKGLDDFFSASTPEEFGSSDSVDGLVDLGGDSTAVILDGIFSSISESNSNSGSGLPGLAGLPPPAPVEIDQAEIDRINSIFTDGFKNFGNLRKGSRAGNRRRTHN